MNSSLATIVYSEEKARIDIAEDIYGKNEKISMNNYIEC